MNNNVPHCKIIEDMLNEAAREAARKAEKLEAYNIALKLLQRGKDTLEEISELTGLTVEEVKEIREQLKTVSA